MSAVETILEVEGLQTSFAVGARRVDAVRDVSFTIRRGESLGLIGESGSGKTVTGLSLLRLLPDHAALAVRTLRYKGRDLVALTEAEFGALRGVEMAMIFQDPVGSFNPAKKMGWQLKQSIARRHGGAVPADWENEATTLLKDVGIRAPERVLGSYPHQLSGGMLQRCLIAMVIALHPTLIVADEPTTNLDNLVERQILDLIRLHQQRIGASVLFVTHDLAIAGAICDRIAVMYAGEIVEIGPAQDVLGAPKHPYAEALLATSQSLERRDDFLFELAGEPGQATPDHGCRFAGRCPRVQPQCRERSLSLVVAAPDHQVRCVLHGS